MIETLVLAFLDLSGSLHTGSHISILSSLLQPPYNWNCTKIFQKLPVGKASFHNICWFNVNTDFTVMSVCLSIYQSITKSSTKSVLDICQAILYVLFCLDNCYSLLSICLFATALKMASPGWRWQHSGLATSRSSYKVLSWRSVWICQERKSNLDWATWTKWC